MQSLAFVAMAFIVFTSCKSRTTGSDTKAPVPKSAKGRVLTIDEIAKFLSELPSTKWETKKIAERSVCPKIFEFSSTWYNKYSDEQAKKEFSEATAGWKEKSPDDQQKEVDKWRTKAGLFTSVGEGGTHLPFRFDNSIDISSDPTSELYLIKKATVVGSTMVIHDISFSHKGKKEGEYQVTGQTTKYELSKTSATCLSGRISVPNHTFTPEVAHNEFANLAVSKAPNAIDVFIEGILKKIEFSGESVYSPVAED